MAEPKRLRQTADKDDNSEDEVGQLKLINPVKTISGRERFPADSCETSVELLPPEVLQLIFNKVESPKDLLSSWYTSSAWRRALRSTEFYFKLTLPSLLPYLTSRDLLQCSSVSKSWNAAVDTCIQMSVENFESSKREQQIVLKLNSNNMSEFIQTFALSSSGESEGKLRVANPVAFRRVEVKLDFQLCLKKFVPIRLNHDPLSVNQDVKNLLKCLNHHGHLIRNLKLDITYFISFWNDKLKLAKSCLKLTPNLQALYTTIVNVVEVDELDEELEMDSSENPWPALKHLKTLAFGPFSDRIELAEIANAYAPQLVDFQFGFKLVEPHQPLTNRFSCLQKIDYFFPASCSGSGIEFAAFVKSNRCPLKHLILIFAEPDKRAVENFDGLAIAANAASDTLRTLYLISLASRLLSEKGLNVDIKKFEKLRLPELKHLQLYGFGYPSLDFLQSACPALEVLSVRPSFSDSRRLEMGENGDIYGDLYSEHQFWNTMPDIRRVVVDRIVELKYVLVVGKVKKVYTREAYEVEFKKDRPVATNNQASLSDEKETGCSRAKFQQNENMNASDD